MITDDGLNERECMNLPLQMPLQMPDQMPNQIIQRAIICDDDDMRGDS